MKTGDRVELVGWSFEATGTIVDICDNPVGPLVLFDKDVNATSLDFGMRHPHPIYVNPIFLKVIGTVFDQLSYNELQQPDEEDDI